MRLLLVERLKDDDGTRNRHKEIFASSGNFLVFIDVLSSSSTSTNKP